MNGAENRIEDVWYAAGLRFECTGCGACCTGAAGYVWVTTADVRRLADAAGLSLDEFGRRYLRRVGTRLALLEQPVTGDCVLLDGRRCRFYEARPAQCRRYPFWPRHLESRQAWLRAAGECEGIRQDAPLLSADRIRELARSS